MKASCDAFVLVVAVQLCDDTSETHSSVPDTHHTSTVLRTSDIVSAERSAAVRCKPPNILVYCGKKDSGRLFAGVKSVIDKCVNTDQYVIYHLKHDDVLTTPWHDNTALLVVASDRVYDGVDQRFLQFFVNGGMLISFGSAFDSLLVERTVRLPGLSGQLGLVTLNCEGHDRLSVIGTKYCYSSPCESLLSDVSLTCLARDDVTHLPVIVEAVHQSTAGLAVLSQVSL